MSTSQEQEFQEADIAVLFRNSFHGDWKPAVPGITREMLSQQTLSSTYYAYKFPKGDVWNSHHGWVVQDVAPEKTVFAEAVSPSMTIATMPVSVPDSCSSPFSQNAA